MGTPDASCDDKGPPVMEFPPIYILSLEGAQRFEPLAEALEARVLAYEVIWGIDGRSRLPEEHEHRVDRSGAEARMGRPMTDGEFACALSHRKIYERIAAGDAPSAIVLEDDADPSLSFSIWDRHWSIRPAGCCCLITRTPM